MRIDAIIWRWLDVLAALLVAWREHQRQRRSLIIGNENGDLVVRHQESDRGASNRDVQSARELRRTVIAAGEAVPARIARAARDGFVILELPADQIVTRRIKVPAQAREFLSGIVRNQIDRLSPWPMDQVVYGFDSEVGGEDAAALDVRVLMASRGVIDSACAAFAEMGLRIDRIVARGSDSRTGDEATDMIAIWSRSADASHENIESVRRLIGVGIAASVAAAVILSGWWLTSASSMRHESGDLAARSRTLQRQIQAGATPASIASLPPAERARLFKDTSASGVIVIEALSRVLPDAAYLTEMRLENAMLRIVGLASDAPALLAPLEQSGHLANVRFFAPTTRGPDGRLFRFHIEGRVEPRIRIEDE